MEAKSKPERTIGQELTWASTMMDYTDAVVGSIPEEALDIRFTDPRGGYFFSARELMMHIADSRWNAAAWINGEDVSDRQFRQEYGGTDRPWKFATASRVEILERLASGRGSIDQFMARPAADLHFISDSQRETHRQRIEARKAQGLDTEALEAGGPLSLADILLFLVAHEQSHRAELQWLMRANGFSVHRLV